MIRVKDPKKSEDFYTKVMGMNKKRESVNKEAGFNLYFLGYPKSNPQVQENAKNPVAEWEGLLELTWNYGTENQEGQVYHNGNTEPQGFGHICKYWLLDWEGLFRWEVVANGVTLRCVCR